VLDDLMGRHKEETVDLGDHRVVMSRLRRLKQST
jgi:hypothetical protein